jgi:hypothetical protein
LRGSELGWAKSWLLRFGLSDEPNHSAKLKLRLGLDLKTHTLSARLRFRTEPLLSSFIDIGEGLSCAGKNFIIKNQYYETLTKEGCLGKLPLPGSVLPILKTIPLRVEYRLRANMLRPTTNTHTTRRESKGNKV